MAIKAIKFMENAVPSLLSSSSSLWAAQRLAVLSPSFLSVHTVVKPKLVLAVDLLPEVFQMLSFIR